MVAIVTTTSAASAAKPPNIPAWYDDEIVHFTVVNDNVEGVGQDVPAIPLYAFGEPGSQPQFDVLSAVPGDASYNPWWEGIFVAILDERNVGVNPFMSEAEILVAEAAGEVALFNTGFVFLCQVLPGRGHS